MKRMHLVAFLSGLLFALGLGLSSMTNPAKVIAFLDVFGHWDPSLAFVMIGAVGVHLVFALRVRRPAARPVLAAHFVLPTSKTMDKRLVVGSALFGLGWGAAGFCPGPAVVSVVTLTPNTLLFVSAMIVGMLLHKFTIVRREQGSFRPEGPRPEVTT